MEKQFRGPLEGTSTHRKVVGHRVRNVDVTRAGYTVPRFEASRHVCCHHKNSLLLVAAPCYSACKYLVCPSKLMWSNFPWSSPLCRPLSISVFLVQSQRACLFCWAVLSRMNVFFISVSRQKKLSINNLCPKPSTLQV